MYGVLMVNEAWIQGYRVSVVQMEIYDLYAHMRVLKDGKVRQTSIW